MSLSQPEKKGKPGNLKQQIFRSILGVGGIKLLSLPVSIVASILLARFLGPEDYGQYVFIISVVTFMALPIAPGLNQLLTREVAKYHHAEDWSKLRGLLKRSHQLVLLGTVLMVTALLAVTAWRSGFGSEQWVGMAIGSALILALGLNAIRGGALRGLRFPLYAQLPDLLARPGVHLIVVGILAFTGFLTTESALVSQVSATTAAFFVGLYFYRKWVPSGVTSMAPEYASAEWGRALIPFTLLSAVSLLGVQVGVLALGWLGLEPEVAALQIATQGSTLVSLPLLVVNLVIGPHVTRAFRDQNYRQLHKLSRYSARLALLGALPVGLTLIFLGAPIVRFVYGEEYLASTALPLAILSAGQLLNVAFGSVGLFLTMTGYEKDTLTGQIIALVVNTALVVLLVPSMGAVGAAIAGSRGLAVWNTLLAIRFYKRLGIRPTALG